MASKKYLSVSRSVACSLAALLVLSGAMFLVTTFQSDSEEWVLVEDQVLDFNGVTAQGAPTGTDDAEYDAVFDEETATYTYTVTGGTRGTASQFNDYRFVFVDGFDFSKNYKFVISSNLKFNCFGMWDGVTATMPISLKSIASDDDGVYSGSIILLDQYMTDLSFKEDFFVSVMENSSSGTFAADEFSLQVYELQTDNTGSIAAGITGLLMIVFGIFAMPSVNILRRR